MKSNVKIGAQIGARVGAGELVHGIADKEQIIGADGGGSQ